MAEKPKRTIRKVDRAEVDGVDDHLWPVNLALLVLTGFVAGIIIVKGSFDDERILYNGWTWLSTLLLSCVGMLYLASRLSQRVGRRLQLAVVFSLIVHVALALLLHHEYLEMIAEQREQEAEPAEMTELPTLPEYVLRDPDEPEQRQSFEEPVPTEVPDEPDEQQHREREPQQQEARRQPTETEQAQQQVRPAPVQLKRQHVSAPRRAESMSRLSKQTEMAQTQPVSPLPVPVRQVTPSQQQPTEPRAQVQPLARNRPQPEATAASQPEEVTTPQQRQAAQMAARAESQQQPTSRSSTPRLERRIAQPADVPRSQVAQAEAASPSQPQAQRQREPQPSVTQRMERARPQVTRRQTEPTLDSPTQVARTETRRQQPARSQPTLARNDAPQPSRQTQQATVASDATQVQTEVARPTPSTDQPEAPASQVARRSPAANRPTRQPTTSDVPSETSEPQSAAMTARRSTSQPAAPSEPAVASRTPRATNPAQLAAAAPAVAEPAPQVTAETARSGIAAPSTSQSRTSTASGAAPARRSTADAPAAASADAPAAASLARSSPASEAAVQPAMNRNGPTSPSRQSTTGALADASAATAQTSAQAEAAGSRSPNAAPAPNAGSFARRSSSTPSRAAAQSATAPAASAGQGLARPSLARAEPADRPSVSPDSGRSGPARRAAAVSELAASPANIESPAMAQSTSSNRPNAQPSATSLSRAEQGMVGKGRSQNFDVAEAASPQLTAKVSSAAARRQQAGQTESGPQPNPAAPARIAKAVAQAEAPSSMLQAQAVENAQVAGAREPSRLNASASAAVQRQASSAPARQASASAGEVTIDTGATQVVAETGAGRASGGGQPELAVREPTPQMSKSAPGGATLAAITAEQLAEAPSAPRAEGGGSPIGPNALVMGGPQRSATADLPSGAEGGATAAPEGESTAAAGAELARQLSDDQAAPEVAAKSGLKLARSSAAAAAIERAAAENPAMAGAPGDDEEEEKKNALRAAALASAGQIGRTGGGLPRSAPAASAPGETPSMAAAEIAAAGLARAGKAAEASSASPQIVDDATGRLARATAAVALAGGTAEAAEHQKVSSPSDDSGTETSAVALDPASGSMQRASEAALPNAGAAGGPSSSEPGSPGELASRTLARAKPTEALPGMEAGGGTAQPASGRGQTVAMLPASMVPRIESMPSEGGAAQGALSRAPGLKPNAQTAGLPGRAASAPVGAAAGATAVDAPAHGGPGEVAAMAKAEVGGRTAPEVGTAADTGAPARIGQQAALLSAVAEEAVSASDLAFVSLQGDPSDLGGAPMDSGTLVTARAPGSLPVRAQAPAGPGGLGAQIAPQVGLPSRRAQRESLVVHAIPDRYLQNKVGGEVSISGAAREVAPSFARRVRREGDMSQGGGGRPSALTEAAIERGIDFLARHQSPDGSWSFHNFAAGRDGYPEEPVTIRSDTAATGLALLAFLGAGYDHFDDKYQTHVRNGLNYLLTHQTQSDDPQADGNLYVREDATSNQICQFYAHGIATLALCEAYGMTGDPNLADPAQRAIDFIVRGQHPERGGWRYSWRYMSDLSVSGWQLMALKSGELAGLEVPGEVYQHVETLLDRCQGRRGDGALYCYNPWAPDTPAKRHGRESSTVMTSVGLLMRLYTGWNRDREAMQNGAEHLLENLPEMGTLRNPPRIGTIGNPKRDTYYWYYATQVMFHMQGKYWKQWNERLHPLLVDTQVKDGDLTGSWDPRKPIPDKWGPHAGRLYVTTMNLLSLEVFYRHLPIYEDTAK